MQGHSCARTPPTPTGAVTVTCGESVTNDAMCPSLPQNSGLTITPYSSWTGSTANAARLAAIADASLLGETLVGANTCATSGCN